MLTGGTGNDVYVLDAGDSVVEIANAGIDTAQSSANFTLGANVENLTLTGISAINGSGNTLNNTVLGNGGNNMLDGGTGQDYLAGGAGDDTYVLDDIGDVVVENAGEGNDTVQTTVSFTAGGNVENVTLWGRPSTPPATPATTCSLATVRPMFCQVVPAMTPSMGTAALTPSSEGPGTRI